MHETHTSVAALPVTGIFHVGRSVECEIVVDHPSLSRKHLRFEFTADRFTVSDLDSSNGTQLGGQRIPPNTAVEFSANDPLVAGDVTLVIQAFRKNRHGHSATPAMPVDAARATPGGTMLAIKPVVIEPTMRRIYDLAARLARGQLCILINGETGVGKEVLADFVHAASPRAKQPFIRVNCAALSDDLIESELFGHERGSFTGAQRDRIGLLESANGGTAMLDEIGEVSLAVQAKLLRVIEQQQLYRVGASVPRTIDVRFIAATNRDLEEDVAAGRFRSDLFFRIAGAVLLIPPLRERPQEIDALARAFAAEAARKQGRATPQFTNETLRLMRAHPWHGNARELRNVVERAILLTDGDIVHPEMLNVAAGRFGLSTNTTSATPLCAAPANDAIATVPLRDQLADFERTRIIEVLAKQGGNQRLAAKALGMPLRTLINRLETYGLPRPRKTTS